MQYKVPYFFEFFVGGKEGDFYLPELQSIAMGC